MIDFEIYTKLEFTLLMLGVLGWVVAYAKIIQNSFQLKFIEMPIVCVAFNMAWEFYLGGAYPAEKIGHVLSWGYKYAIIIDVLIVFCVLAYAPRHISHPNLKKWFRPLFIIGLVFAYLLNYYFIQNGWDTVQGSVTGFILNGFISYVYIAEYLRSKNQALYSLTVAVSRFAGTAAFWIFNCIVYGDNTFLVLLGVLTTILDIAFIVMLLKDRKRVNFQTL